MTPAFVQGVALETLKVMMLVSMPALLVALVVGLVISVLQATTQIQEQTLSFIPKMISIYVVLILFGGFMIDRLMIFSTEMFTNFARFVK